MSLLLKKKCVPCEGNVKPLTQAEIDVYMPEVAGWQVAEGLKKIVKEWRFKDFIEGLIFINEVAHLAEEEGHHPDIRLYSYNKVQIEIYTHAIGGLSENDFILAAKINAIDIRHLL